MKYVLFAVAVVSGIRLLVAIGLLLNNQPEGSLVITSDIVPFVLSFGFYLVVNVLEKIERKNKML